MLVVFSQTFVPVSQLSVMKLIFNDRPHGVEYGGACCGDARLYAMYSDNATTIGPASTPCIPGVASLD